MVYIRTRVRVRVRVAVSVSVCGSAKVEDRLKLYRGELT